MGALTDAATPADRALQEAIFSAWLAGDRVRSFPGGEAFADVVRRVREGLPAALAAAPSARAVVVVAHRMPIAAAAALCDPGGGASARGGCPNGSITALELELLDGERWRLLAGGDARHLA